MTTLILSWNRSDLLRRTLASYLETTSVPHEVWVVDNNSDHATRQVIAEARRSTPELRVLQLDHNLGGEALNILIPEIQSDFVHISENDLRYRPGWDRQMLRKFELFPELGQLSPFSPYPEVEAGEVWHEKPAHPVDRDRQRIYLAEAGLGTSCVLRRSILDAGIRWRSIASGPFRFPDDAGFSAGCKSVGLLVAWNDRYVAQNLGHNVVEMCADVEYYVSNYAHKSWLGVDGLRRRLETMSGPCLGAVNTMLARLDERQGSTHSGERDRGGI